MNFSSRETKNQKTLCRHFGECGSCRFQDSPYPQQVEEKKERVKTLMEEFSFSSSCLRPINHYQPWFYRNKMEFTFSDKNGLECGMYSQGKRGEIFDIKECLIFSPDTDVLLDGVREFARARGYTAYDRFSHKGFLRNLLVRRTEFTEELMVGIVTRDDSSFDREGFVRALRALDLEAELKSIYWIGNNSLSDAVVFEKKELLWGQEFIREKLGRFYFNIGIDSFFQVNPRAADDFYQKIKSHASLTGTETVLDLFCGVGGIGMFLAADAKFVWGVELGPEIVAAARLNARENKINNISFFASEARRFLNTQGSFYKDVDVLILNPPRCGLSPRIIRAIKRLNPQRIIYSSCNPKTLFANLKDFSSSWRLDFVEPFDFFPHTPHLECLSFLSRCK